MRYHFLKVVLLSSFFSFAQTKITGEILDQGNTILQGATIVTTKIKSDIVVSYAISDANGQYSLEINSTLDSLQIDISHIGYTTQSKIISNETQTLNVTLLESSEKLKEVVLKNAPITRRGDTINYSVNAFKDQKDRVIADVLRKLPGIEVLEDGKILYQGEPIQKYYIEGLDLLEGNYNLANNNLPAASVSKVQVLENHQPIRLLDSLVFSDKASLNIKLKKKVTVTSTASLGIGVTPLLWKANITPLLFSKKHQAITSYQSNNIGIDISNEVKTLTIEDLLDQFENNTEKKDWVRIQELAPPLFSKERWLDNNAHLVTTNHLLRLKKDIDFKVNVSYINDVQQQNGNTQTTFFTPIDTINIVEDTNNELFFNSLRSKFILTKNTKKNYFKNTFEANNHWNSQRGLLTLNTEDINQRAKIPFSSFSNKLKIIKPFGKKLITVKSIITYSRSSQNLVVTPGVFEGLLNNGDLFNELNQRVEHANFYTNNSFSFTKGIKRFTFNPKVGFSIQNQQLDSQISIFDNNIESVLNDEFQNNLRFNKTTFYSILNTQYRYNNWKLELDAPLKFQLFKRADNNLEQQQDLNRITFEPRLLIKRDLNSFWKTTFSASLKNTFGDIDQLYFGYILNNYRNIQRYEAPILERQRGNLSFGVAYRNPLKSIFINGFYTYGSVTQNVILNNLINSDGSTSLGFFRQDNSSNTHNINLSGSTYFSKLKTTLAITTNGFLENKEQFLNDVLTDVTTKNIQLKGKLDTEVTDWMSVSYNNEIVISNSQFKNQPAFQSIITQEHSLKLNFYPNDHQYIGFETEYYKNNFSTLNQENYFLNLNYRYTFKKSNIDVEFNLNNILNTKEFTTVFNDAFSYTRSTFQLRPRQVLMNIRFNL